MCRACFLRASQVFFRSERAVCIAPVQRVEYVERAAVKVFTTTCPRQLQLCAQPLVLKKELTSMYSQKLLQFATTLQFFSLHFLQTKLRFLE